MPWRRLRRREVIEEGAPPPLPPRADPWPWLFLLVALVTAGVIGLWWYQNEEHDEPARTTTTVVTEETTTAPTEPAATTTETETVVETETVEEDGALVEVPDVTGPTEDEARRIAEEAGFDVRVEDTNAPTAEEVGEVVLQRPDAGTRAPEGSEITLFVGR